METSTNISAAAIEPSTPQVHTCSQLRWARADWQAGTVPSGGRKRERRIRRVISLRVSQKARHYEHDARIENAIPDLYRQMDTQDFVFAERATSATRGVAPAHRNCLAAECLPEPFAVSNPQD